MNWLATSIKNINFARPLHFLALITLSLVTAWAVGRMIGRSQHDSVVLSSAWALISLKFAKVDNDKIDTSLLSMTFAMILFLYMLVYASHSSHYDEEIQKTINARTHFEDCSYNEFIINNAREALELPPLKSELFCNK